MDGVGAIEAPVTSRAASADPLVAAGPSAAGEVPLPAPSLVAECLDPAMRQRLVAFARRIVLDGVEAEDIAQEVLLRAGGATHALQSGARPDAWLLRVCRHVAIDHLRSRRVRSGVWHPMPEDAETWARPGRHDPHPRAVASRRRSPRRARRALRPRALSLRDLPASAHVLMSLHYERGLSQPTICRLTGLSTSALRVRLFRARGTLQELARMG